MPYGIFIVPRICLVAARSPEAASQIAVTIDSDTPTQRDRLVREQRYAIRSREIQEALDERLQRLEDKRLSRELEPQSTQGVSV